MTAANLTGAGEIRERERHDFSRAASTAPPPPASAAEGNNRRPKIRVTLRWLKFNAVGALGAGVQLAVLLTLKSGIHLNYLLATAFAVEAAVLHNFLWHERYTWADRVRPSLRKSFPRLLRFNLTNGLISIAGNLVLMKWLVGMGRGNYLLANGVSIVVCSLVNFAVSEAWVFESEAKQAEMPTTPSQ